MPPGRRFIRSPPAARRIAMTTGTHDKAEGTVHQVKGAVKEQIGKMTNNPNLQDEGTAEKIDGKVQKKIGEIKDGIRQITK
jgi:uncharacterized protein YjbJ (UPF0337 family)